MTQTTILIDSEVRQKLKIYVANNNIKTYSEAISKLIENNSNTN